MMGLKAKMLLAAAVAGMACGWAVGFVFIPGPPLTLRVLLGQADSVLVLEFSPADPNGFANARVVKTFKQDSNLLEDVSQGQQAGCLGDFGGRGALDMALVLAGGDVCIVPRKVTKEQAPTGLRLSLSPGGEHAGPVGVTVIVNKRNLGAWTVSAGGAPVVVGTRPLSTVELRWRWPGGETGSPNAMDRVCGPLQTRRVKVLEAVVPVVLDDP